MQSNRNYNRVYAAYAERTDREVGYFIRAGRQNPNGAGVLERFDGNGSLDARSVSVLAGDFLLTRALEEVAGCGLPAAMPHLLTTIRRMIEGEALQLSLRGSSAARMSPCWAAGHRRTKSWSRSSRP